VPAASDRAAAFDDHGSSLPGAPRTDGRRVIRLAAYGIIRRGGTVLLCRVASGYPGGGTWTLPGGGLEFAEHPEAGAVREVEEETGLVARVSGAPMILSNYGTWPRDPEVAFHQVRFVYPMEVVGGAERVEVGGSTDRFGWFTLDEARALPIVGLASMVLGLPVLPGEEETYSESNPAASSR